MMNNTFKVSVRADKQYYHYLMIYKRDGVIYQFPEKLRETSFNNKFVILRAGKLLNK